MSHTLTPKKVYAATSNISRCRLCGSVGDHCKKLFGKANRALLETAEELYGSSLPQSEELPHLICRPCERRLNNFKVFKTTISESQASFDRVKRCIEVSPSAPRTLKRSKANEAVRSSRRGLLFCGAEVSIYLVLSLVIILFFCIQLSNASIATSSAAGCTIFARTQLTIMSIYCWFICSLSASRRSQQSQWKKKTPLDSKAQSWEVR